MTHSGKGFSTRAIHTGQEPDPTTGAIMTPIYASSTYAQEEPGKHKGYEYSRSGNPTRTALEQCLASLEEGEQGLAFASGLAATAAVLSTLQPGDEVLAPADLYGGTFRILDKVYKPWGVQPIFLDNPTPEAFANAVTAKTKMIWIESPTNPLLQILDIRGLAKVASPRGITLVVDNTFASPYLQKPLQLGAQIVVHSTTKYLGGHSDVIGGAVIGAKELLKPIKFYQNAAGGVPGPFDCFLVLRGIKTLAVRMERHCQNAKMLAQWLNQHKQVDKVYFPGLECHSGHALAKEQMRGFGGMISIRLKGGPQALARFFQKIKIFSLAESLGGVESLICHPATMTHASIPADQRVARGIDDFLLRLSIGIEDFTDLQADLESALES